MELTLKVFSFIGRQVIFEILLLTPGLEPIISFQFGNSYPDSWGGSTGMKTSISFKG